jgi:hypothetical protein
LGAAIVSTVSRRLKNLEDRIALQKHRELERQLEGRSEDEQSFFIIHGYWPENAGDILPHRLEFTVRGIKTIVITQRADEHKKTTD